MESREKAVECHYCESEGHMSADPGDACVDALMRKLGVSNRAWLREKARLEKLRSEVLRVMPALLRLEENCDLPTGTATLNGLRAALGVEAPNGK